MRNKGEKTEKVEALLRAFNRGVEEVLNAEGSEIKDWKKPTDRKRAERTRTDLLRQLTDLEKNP